LDARPILVTGAAGFIGYHVANALLERGDRVIGVDNLNAYYSPQLKRDRVALLNRHESFQFVELELASSQEIDALVAEIQPQAIVHLAAQAGVRYSLENPAAYIQSNIVAFANLLESCRKNSVGHLLYASSSSVYGNNKKLPFATTDNVDHPVSLYAATKKSNELMAHSYSHLFGIPTTGLRFFTVYGPWGRPDMAMYLFTKALFEGTPIKLFNHGDMLRDFTYIDDVVDGVVRVLDVPPSPESKSAADPEGASPYYRVYNIGHNDPVPLLELVSTLEAATGRKAITELLPMQAGDVYATFADISPLQAVIGFDPSTPLKVGAERFVAWYREYYKV
jgi:UDP-glucuronate 4-epimerase